VEPNIIVWYLDLQHEKTIDDSGVKLLVSCLAENVLTEIYDLSWWH